jgi:hypothetical protein
LNVLCDSGKSTGENDECCEKELHRYLARLNPQTDKRAFACFAPLRETQGFVTAQLRKHHGKTQSTQRKKLNQRFYSFRAPLSGFSPPLGP